ncbi:hypothetical protein B0T22DRAFT_431857 [Podospora appendiculata]|uniref:Uncharacterized protein n=1 Tax=Podospora appendiculata TaxID=314037 RepID=A0AAE0X3C2_9PEZI|nr:hypothetical protein B0T22DRAFT_431857 [Podospora appendiculata]
MLPAAMSAVQQLRRSSTYMASNMITLPYYRFYRQNTLLPVLAIVKAVKEGERDELVSRRMRYWRERKLREYQFVSVAGTLLAAAVIGCFSWMPQDSEHWLGPAAWYSCLVMSLFAILLSSSEAFIFSTIKDGPRPRLLAKELAMIALIKDHPGKPHLTRQNTDRERGKETQQYARDAEIRWNMVFTWQAPVMLIAYAVTCFLMGLTINVCTPLYDGMGFRDASKASIFYIVSFILSGAVFVWCSFWAYRFIDLEDHEHEHEHDQGLELDTEPTMRGQVFVRSVEGNSLIESPVNMGLQRR